MFFASSFRSVSKGTNRHAGLLLEPGVSIARGVGPVLLGESLLVAR